MTGGQARPPNAFTVDLEDWFQGLTSTNPMVQAWPSFESRVVSATTSLLDLLESCRVTATFFVLGYVAEQYPALVEQVYARGHEVAVHGYLHRFVNRLAPDEFDREVDRGIKAVYDITGVAPLGHRAPYFSINRDTLWALDVLREHGFRYDSSFFPTRNMLYGYPGAQPAPHRVGEGKGLIEFPVSTVRLAGHNLPFAGGFYMRAWPYQFIRWGIRRLQNKGSPAILYVHPWELDLAQPRFRVTPRERITHYHGRRTLRHKLERLFADFHFGPLSDLLDSVHE
ncbi:MAG: DUF3473 domain-containing protein [Chloroflexi bacterium]|nr:DUF3473 domain-containing protein [Chloroflexota bacterium]